MTLSWTDQLKKFLLKTFDERLAKKYQSAFPVSYCDVYSLKEAKQDISVMEKLSSSNDIDLYFYVHSPEKNSSELHLRLFQYGKATPLSIILPLLENLDLKVQSEQPYKITPNKGERIWISDFVVEHDGTALKWPEIKDLFREALIFVYHGIAENDGFNKLVLRAQLTWREVFILRAYVKYLQQIQFQFSQAYIEKILAQHPAIARQLVEFFKTRHNPKAHKKNNQSALALIEKAILQGLEKVTNLNEDRILRRLLDLMKATLRTNYFQSTAKGEAKSYLSFKLNCAAIPDLPLPVPLYEIYVYSQDFEGIHLRNTKVARGGIRWSDRKEDFRTEVLGLMKAQKVKNAVIVPSGAKGGFVLKHISEYDDNNAVKTKVIQCYQQFIKGLLDLTDNICDKQIISPNNVICYDEYDPYLVVAADKGTATFSDTANAIAKEYNFWLGDAFASGGKTGYDHKKIGITARGAWESIKRHFRELDIDVENQEITVIGIGDMSGDVFGNGMIYSKHIKLLAAFDHRHIFIDPNPHKEVSYYERLRLFNLPTSSWQDYNPKLISTGGGVFSRNLKSITLTTQMKQVLATESNALSPNELISVLLKAPVDLLFNGGIGTYVKASQETHFEVGDRANDFCRINGGDLRCRVVGEGGNLGFTQLGRIEYAAKNGIINTDFIDNSAGVDCSDHEVNLKILLNYAMRRGKLSEKKRNQLLAQLTREIAQLVLEDNFSQALVMSFSAWHNKKNMTLHTNFIKELETQNYINRKVEFLPDEKKLLERKAAGDGLTRPELAVLLAYSKIQIKHEILKSKLPEDPYFVRLLEMAFPMSIRKKYKNIMLQHDLRRDIIATQLSNQIVNEMGFTFIYRMQMETNALTETIVRAYMIASQIFAVTELAKMIDGFGNKIPLGTQYEMRHNLRNLINLATRWFLHSQYLHNNLTDTIAHFSPRIKTLEKVIPEMMSGFTKRYLTSLIEEFENIGLPTDTARHIATYRAIYTALNIIDVSTQFHFDLMKTAQVYFSAGEQMNLVWFRDQIAQDSRDGHWNVVARLTLRDELDAIQRTLTRAVIQSNKKENKPDKLMNEWLQKNKQHLVRWEKMQALLHSSTNIDYAMFFVAIRELSDVITKSMDSKCFAL